MLKALELVGFKSFADKTRFAFPRGVTVVVGPNGSGKSNIVDAIKWVLGEQSVKSLRGKEMADVIFNGSSSRRAQNSAECTLAFDNTSGLVDFDAPEVSVTRRVYRSGEGEYLINGQASRLKDIRELFAGTGVTTQAYSVIEQGKVDVLLQSSPRDRRMIFEEAAGISRFKAKKLEATRRLERVDQNLLRLSDIVDEVESRLRTIRNQASKARRYREYTERLQQIRTQVGLVDWRKLSEKLEGLQAQVAEWTEKAQAEAAHADQVEEESHQADARVDEIDGRVRSVEGDAAQNRERIASLESRIEHQRERSTELEDEVLRNRRRLAVVSSDAGDLVHELAETTKSVAAARSQRETAAQRVAELDDALAEQQVLAEKLRQEHSEKSGQHGELVRQMQTCTRQISNLESRLEAAGSSLARVEPQLDKTKKKLSNAEKTFESLASEKEKLVNEVERRRAAEKTTRESLKQHKQTFSKRQKQRAELAERHAAARERSAVLDDLEKRLEGLGSAVKEILIASRQGGDGPYSGVRGLVADLVHVSVESASLIEVALGDAAQFLVVSDSKKLWEHLGGKSTRLPASVGFVCLDLPSQSSRTVDLSEKPGVVGRADRFVRCDPVCPKLGEMLLSHTWVVESLEVAFDLSRSSGPETRFVTLAGELVAPRGVIVTGPRRGGAGLISRRSELRALGVEIDELAKRMAEQQVALDQIEQTTRELDDEVDRLVKQRQSAEQDLRKHELQIEITQERRDQYASESAQLKQRLDNQKKQVDANQGELDQAQQHLVDLQAQTTGIERQLQQHTEQLESLTQQQSEVGEKATIAKVELATSEQRLDSLQVRLEQCQHNQQQRQHHIDESRANLRQALEQSEVTLRSILDGESELAELYVAKERLTDAVEHLVRERRQL
ncbi:MAG: chromosome segregation protein SMC, partial [Pirellulales bacterium]|nr:chromosome segregation protein SMC [Pirellulales bacterium]